MQDPQGCRDFAKQCIEMANSAAYVKMQSLLFDMAAAWMEVAKRLERQVVKDSDARSEKGADEVRD
jgi:hypothetical protein